MIFRGLFFEHNEEIGQKDHLWMDTNYILDMVKTEGGVKILLDIDRVLNSKEISVFEKAA